MSAVVGVKVTVPPHWFVSVPATILAGQAMVGGVVSTTVTVKLQTLALPLSSKAAQ